MHFMTYDQRQRRFVFAWRWMCFFNCCHSAQINAYWFRNLQKSYQCKIISCFSTVESHLEHKTLLLQLNCYKKSYYPFNETNQLLYIIVEADGLIDYNHLHTYVLHTGIEATYVHSNGMISFHYPRLLLYLSFR